MVPVYGYPSKSIFFYSGPALSESQQLQGVYIYSLPSYTNSVRYWEVEAEGGIYAGARAKCANRCDFSARSQILELIYPQDHVFLQYSRSSFPTKHPPASFNLNSSLMHGLD
jgi:hypothetical protein